MYVNSTVLSILPFEYSLFPFHAFHLTQLWVLSQVMTKAAAEL